MEKHDYEEFLTPEELIKLYDLEEGEDLREFVRKINSLSKGDTNHIDRRITRE